MHSANNRSLNNRAPGNHLDADRVIVGLSGGVDSAVAAAQLKAQGYQVHGVTLNLWQLPESQGNPDEDAINSAQRIAEAVGINLTVRDLRNRFYETVVVPFMTAYQHGMTPNPCVLCNPRFKFKALLETADAMNYAWIATGHYARVVHQPDDLARLLTGLAQAKDQSYALYRLRQPQLRRLLLPLGELETKAHVRELARAYQIPSAEREDSQDLCFVSGGDYRTALRAEHPDAFQPGPIYNETGQQLGEHSGLAGYTVGQRSGLGIASSERIYVLRLDTARNALIVGPRDQLEKTACIIDRVTFIAGHPPASHFRVKGRIRYRAPLSPLTVDMLTDTRAHVTFKQPQRAIAPGQSLVFYRGNEVLGGGLIAETPAHP